MKPFLRSSLQASLVAIGILASAVTAQAETPDDTLVMASVIDDIISLDPAEIYEISASEYKANTYDRLVVLDPDNPSQLKLQAAESWSVSDDGKTFTFKIRPGIKFSTGNDLTAEDVKFSFDRFVMLNKSPAFILNQFGLTDKTVQEATKAVDPSTFTVTLDNVYSPSFFLNCLSFTSDIVDSKEVKSHEVNGDWGYEWLRTNYAGSGPFVLTGWKPNESLSLEANPNYWDGAPIMKRVLIRNVTESASQQLLLQKGDIDIARNLTGDQVAAVKGDANIKMMFSPKATLWYMGLNTKNQYIAKKEVRQAMKYLVDYDGLQDTMFNGTGIKHQAIVPDGQLGAYNENPFSLDVAKAKELLAQAGVPDGFDITMETTNKSETRELSASIQNTLAQAGINLIIKLADNRTTLTKYRASEHDIYLGVWGSDYQDPHSNTEGYLIAPLAKRNVWQDDARTAAKRAQMYVDLQKMALDESPFVIMFQQVETIALRNNVDGFISGPSFDLDLYKKVKKN
jgi:peptide/nickel transport system substrate-binding protein